MHSAYLSLGSNINPADNIPKALQLLAEELTLLQVSSAWCTAPVGTHGPSFVNLAVHVSTPFDCATLKTKILQKIETRLGRLRTKDKFAPRTIDIDISLFDNELMETELPTTAYLLLPLAELIPAFVPPGQSRSLSELAEDPSVHKSAVRLELFPNSGCSEA